MRALRGTHKKHPFHRACGKNVPQGAGVSPIPAFDSTVIVSTFTPPCLSAQGRPNIWEFWVEPFWRQKFPPLRPREDCTGENNEEAAARYLLDPNYCAYFGLAFTPIRVKAFSRTRPKARASGRGAGQAFWVMCPMLSDSHVDRNGSNLRYVFNVAAARRSMAYPISVDEDALFMI